MNELIDERICTNQQCEYAATGLCVEGNIVQECPHTQLNEVAPQNDVTAGTSSPSVDRLQSDLVHFGGDEHLSVLEASQLLGSQYAPVIAFLGAPGVGKTSLIAQIYDAFQYGKYESLSFAGSRTLMAFEQICHKVRASSRAPLPTQDRSEINDDPFFFHLAINCDTVRRPAHILLADRSGEIYRAIADDPKISEQCLELKRAASLNVLVDGAQLCEPMLRTTALSACAQSVQTLALQGLLTRDSLINLVMTKLDLVDKHENGKRACREFDALACRIPILCNGLNLRVIPFKIAACPQNDSRPKGYGVEALVQSWVSITPPQGTYSRPILNSERAMGRTPSSLAAS